MVSDGTILKGTFTKSVTRESGKWVFYRKQRYERGLTFGWEWQTARARAGDPLGQWNSFTVHLGRFVLAAQWEPVA